ncbi:hypothetical protein RvY_19179 [Ramazzottius varieornatus]|uniref:Uncharacterized protein n=1 Tax=Ramazzottius varieornatus TaxID=947166 RepID=A0A1D1WC44_RAMVA|nr:hypothetical protein RvY_19179 [Ramazzottius varieornatus]
MSSTRSSYELMDLAFRNRGSNAGGQEHYTRRLLCSYTTHDNDYSDHNHYHHHSHHDHYSTPPGADNASSVVTFDPVGVINTTFSPITPTVMSTTTPADERGLAPLMWMALGGLLAVLFYFLGWLFRKLCD